MGFSEAVRTCLRKYFTFSGRASRPEYWYFVLFTFLGGFVAGIVDGMVFHTGGGGPLSSIFSLATLIPSFSAGWRRMHDTGRSGFFLIYPLIAMIGVTSFVGFLAGIESYDLGSIGDAILGVGGVVAVMSFIVLFLSPLLVLWWLTRPTQPEANQWGPPPA